MTNLLATISVVLVTNWTMTSIQRPVVPEGEATQLVYRQTGYHETGAIFSNKVAMIHWGTNRIPATVESKYIGQTQRVTWR